jgi:hypothetical protein
MGTSGGELLVGNEAALGWWLVTGSLEEDGLPLRVVAGPFPDEADASCAALCLTEGPDRVRPVYATRRADGSLLRRSSPQERQWLDHLGDQLDRLPLDWDEDLTDGLVTLVVDVAAAVCDAGLPLEDPTSAAPGGQLTGGVRLVPDADQGGVVVSWQQHERMSIEGVRGAGAHDVLQQVMSSALFGVLVSLGLPAEPFAGGSAYLVRLSAS